MAQTKKSFSTSKIAKGHEFKLSQFYESIIISFSGGFIH